MHIAQETLWHNCVMVAQCPFIGELFGELRLFSRMQEKRSAKCSSFQIKSGEEWSILIDSKDTYFSCLRC